MKIKNRAFTIQELEIISAANAEIYELEQRIIALEDALRPFAQAADLWDSLLRQGRGGSASDVVPLVMEPYQEARRLLQAAGTEALARARKGAGE